MAPGAAASEEVQLNLAYRWFCRLGLKSKAPNPSTFLKNR
jgi:transposase